MVTKRPFGTTKDGAPVTAYTLANEHGFGVSVLDYGATLQSVVLPHKGGRIDVVLGYDTIEEYENNDGYLGASIGRFAGRIPGARLNLDGTVFSLSVNEGKNHLHGGFRGFDKRVWNAAVGSDLVTFSLVSPDGEEGFPGKCRCFAIFSLSNDALSIKYIGASDRVTAWNPPNHAYWNLNGHDAGDALRHRLEIPADRYVPVGPDMIPTHGEADVTDTRFDFRQMREIGEAYDHSFVLSGGPITLWGNRGIGMEIETDCRAVQLYTAEYLTERSGKSGAVYRPFGAVCLETEGRQTLRNKPVAQENVLSPCDEQASRKTTYRFLYKED